MVASCFILYCLQNISAIEQKVEDLQDSVYHLMVVIVENGDEVIVKAAKGIKRDIKDLLRYAEVS